MKIDLHCHTRNIKSGDGSGREVTDELFIKKVKSSGVEVIAVTNHNMFDDVQFLRLQEKVKDTCKLWPGVEFDIGYGEDGKIYHLLVVCNPKNTVSFKHAVAEIIDGYTPEDFVGDIKEVIAKFDPLDCLFLPHFLGKTPTIPDDELEGLVSLLSNSSRLIVEASNIRSMGIFVSHGISSITGSDIKDWDEYPGKDMMLPELRLRIEEFEHLCRLLDRDPVIVKTLLDKNKSTPYDVYPNPKNRDIKEQLHFYKEINVIFGDKGTGKSEVVKCLENKLKSEETPYAAYISGGTKDYLDELLNTEDMERSANVLGLDGCDDAFDTVRNWGDRPPTPLSEYIDHFESRTNKESAQRIGWSRMSDQVDDADTRLEQIGKDLENIHSGRVSINEVKITDYLDVSDNESLENLLDKLEASVSHKEKLTDTEDRAVKLVNFTLGKFRKYTAVKTGGATRPQDSGFGKFAKNRLTLKNAVCGIKSNLTFKEVKKYISLGDIGEKGKIEIEIRHRILNDYQDTKSDHKEFSGNITKLRELKEKISKVNSLTLKISLDDELVELKDKLTEFDIRSVDDFVGIYKQTVDKNRMPYTLSTGERSIIFMQRTLNDQEATVFLLDEPEQSMANSYIDDIIRPRIIELGQQKKTVIMATHNANLAVRTLPYSTIYRSHDERGYNTYVGNPFTNQLVNIADASDTRNWKETSMKILEGGKEAFYDREGIYESGK